MDSTFVVEQPHSSLFFHYMYIQELFRMLIMAGLKAKGFGIVPVEWVWFQTFPNNLLTWYLTHHNNSHLKNNQQPITTIIPIQA